MKLNCRAMMILFAVSVVSGCMPGDFCDIARPIHFEPDVAVVVVQEDRRVAEVIDSQNRYGEDVCPGWAMPV